MGKLSSIEWLEKAISLTTSEYNRLELQDAKRGAYFVFLMGAEKSEFLKTFRGRALFTNDMGLNLES